MWRRVKKESDWLIFHLNKKKIEQTNKKAATKVVHKRLHREINIQRTYNIKEIVRLSLRVEFVDCDITRQCKNLETLWSFVIFSRVPMI